MAMLIWAGTAVTLAGLAGLIVCIGLVVRARRSGLDDAALRSRLQTIVAYNFGALAVSALGLILVVLGITLG
ncbi:MAG: hypothetical protein ACOY5U_10335 [Pseudomonadota bacterium]